MNRFEDLTNFVTIVETGGISAAADRLNLSKSVVSRRLKLLEDRLDTQLVVRTTRTQRVTNEGQTFYDRCKQILTDLEEAEQALTTSTQMLTGSLRISAPVFLGQKIIAPALTQFMSEHPNVVVELDLADRHVSLVEEGYDLAIRIGHLPDSTMIARKLAPVAITTFASPSYLAANGPPRTLHQLADHAGLLHRSGPAITGWRYHDQKGELQTADTHRRMVSNDDTALLRAACDGLGIVCMPDFMAADAVNSGELVPILTDIAWHEIAAYAVYPPTRHLSNRVRSFVDFLTARLAGSLDPHTVRRS